MPDTETKPGDDAYRQQIGPPLLNNELPDLTRFETEKNFVVRAAAGSGKTTALVARMVGLVRRGKPVDGIVAITFTRKAAGEMKKRFYEELRKTGRLLEEEGAEEEAERVRRALKSIGQCFIGTIHSFCARLLREHALEAGVPPDFATELDEGEEERHRRRAWQRYLRTQWESNADQIRRLVRLGVSPGDLYGFFEDLCKYEDLDLYVDEDLERPDLMAVVREVQAFMDTWQARRPDEIPGGKGPDVFMRFMDETQEWIKMRDLDQEIDQVAFLQRFAEKTIADSGNGRVTLSCWGQSRTEAYERARELKNAIPRLIDEVIEPALHQWEAWLYHEIVQFVQPAVSAYSATRHQEGRLTMQDLLLLTRELLQDNSEVRERVQEQHRYLLVDEFQDTDPLQAEILFYLTGENVEETDWRKCRPRPGSLFIVGDDKQSIYRFRRADMHVFNKVADLMEACDGKPVPLSTNFRSLSPLCEWWNSTFEVTFSERELVSYQAKYAKFKPSRTKSLDDTCVRQLTIEKVGENFPEPIVQAEARRIANFIEAAKAGKFEHLEGAVFEEGGASYGDFMILTRRNKRLHLYAAELARRGIPYTITGSKDLGSSEELRALVDMLTCVFKSDDAVARVAYLRGRLVGLSDDELYRFKKAGGSFCSASFDLKDETKEKLEGALAARIEGAFERLQRARMLLRLERPTTALTRIVDETGLLAQAVHAAPDRSLRGGRLLRALTLVRHLDDQGTSWPEILETLQRVVDGDEEVDGMTLETGREDAVRIMNVHQAKGLEAPVVFLADPYDRYHNTTPSCYVRREKNDIVMPVVKKWDDGSTQIAAPLAWHETYEKEAERAEAAEERRIQYVAATRAENLLVISRYDPPELEKPEKGFWWELNSFLDERDVPELERGDALVEDDTATKNTSLDLDRIRADRRERIEQVAAPSYTSESASDKPDDSELKEQGRYGSDFGTAVHALFEQAIQQGAPPSEAMIRGALKVHCSSCKEHDVERAARMVEGFVESNLWRALQAAERVLTEFPLVGVEREGEGEHLTRGVIDLLYQGADGWHIVDFKTNHVPDADAERELVAHYASQIEAYTRHWASVTGEPVAEGALWLADVGRLVPIAGGAKRSVNPAAAQ